MTYKNYTVGTVDKEITTRLIELTRSAGLSVATGDVLLFDSLRETSVSGVTNNATTGEITLPLGYEYYIVASIEIDRNANSDSFRIAWVDSNGTEIQAADGGFDCRYDWHSSSVNNNVPNFTMSAVLMTSEHSSVYLKCMSMTAGSTMTAQTSILITQAAI